MRVGEERGGVQLAAFTLLELAGEELGPMERSADIPAAARLKARSPKCMCAADVRGKPEAFSLPCISVSKPD